MNIFIIIVFIIFGVFFYIIQQENHESKINEQINSIGGTVINIERKTFSTGPFIMPGKGRTVYRIEYSMGSTVKEGWVKFGGFFGTDWRL